MMTLQENDCSKGTNTRSHSHTRTLRYGETGELPENNEGSGRSKGGHEDCKDDDTKDGGPMWAKKLPNLRPNHASYV